MPANYSTNIVYLSKTQYQELLTNQTITVNGTTVNYNENDIYVTPQAEPITDVKLAGISIGNNGVANIPYADVDVPGLLKTGYTETGIYNDTTYHFLKIAAATDDMIQLGYQNYRPIVPTQQHKSVFYGLSKAAGVDLANETVTLGTYPNASKAAIQKMLGISSLLAPIEDDGTADAAYTVGSLFTSNGKLYKATAAIAVGDMISSGTNCEETTITNIFAKKAEVPIEYGSNTGAIKIKDFSSSTASYSSTASGMAAVAFGASCVASGNASVAMGLRSVASGGFSFASGYETIASGTHSVALGSIAVASGRHSVAFGNLTSTTGVDSFAYGCANVEDSYSSWPEWTANTSYTVGDKVKRTTTSNNTTVINGYECKIANTDSSFTDSKWTDLQGKMNYIEIAGNGTTTGRSNAYALDWSGNGRFAGNIYVGCNSDSTGGTRVPHDVKIGNNSIVSNGVATIPVRTNVVSGSSDLVTSNGIYNTITGLLYVTSAQIKEGTNALKVVPVSLEHEATFYGLAKAAGDSTQASSQNAVGTYTAQAKAAIQSMIGVESGVVIIETVSGTTPSITGLPNYRYICGEVSTLSVAPPANGTIIVRFDSGSTATVLTVPNTVKWPEWFDATSLETDVTYEIMITDGVYGAVMSWA